MTNHPPGGLGQAPRGGPDRVQRVALGASTCGQSLGSADLHDLFTSPLEEHRQPGAETASSLHRPQATARNLPAGEAEQPLVTGRITAGRGLGQHAAEVGDGGGGQGVAVGVDANDTIDELCQLSIAVVLGDGRSASAWEESPRGTTVTGHNPCRVGQAADQASEVGQADAGTTADSSDLKATHTGRQLQNESYRDAGIRA